ncbi:unnamed protein product [Bursaphelenchus xylophilus]|uniref:(pine wood nematode) hypothetical protein n=1 Tax=Bursaphelenchus xylophilus TaxID=6326 RepID=A0A1I7S9F6_BURXY|nr:unnamed protein product [Bursaphelenchus xylophilus]CAG9111064.1 unnamed protein product [Bursaphelenchus xylophilus]
MAANKIAADEGSVIDPPTHREVNPEEKFENSVLLLGVPEFSAPESDSNADDATAHDLAAINKCLDSIRCRKKVEVVSLVRLGKRDDADPRPLLLGLGTHRKACWIVDKARNSSDKLGGIRIIQAETKMQFAIRRINHWICNELKKDNGKKDFCIHGNEICNGTLESKKKPTPIAEEIWHQYFVRFLYTLSLHKLEELLLTASSSINFNLKNNILKIFNTKTYNKTHTTTIQYNCLLLNFCSLKSKLDKHKELLHGKKFDMIFVTETWLKESDEDDYILLNSDYTVHRADRKKKRGGGCAIFVKNGIPVSNVRNVDNHYNLSCFDLLSPDNSIYLRVILVYRPPSLKAEYNRRMIARIYGLCFDSRRVVVLGDFNFPSIDWSQHSWKHAQEREFVNFAKNLNLGQKVLKSTRKEHIIDLVLADFNLPEDVVVSDSHVGSDHRSVQFKLPFSSMLDSVSYSHRNFHEADWPKIESVLAKADWDGMLRVDPSLSPQENIDRLYATFSLFLLSVIAKFVPVSPSEDTSELIDKRGKIFSEFCKFPPAEQDCISTSEQLDGLLLEYAKSQSEENEKKIFDASVIAGDAVPTLSGNPISTSDQKAKAFADYYSTKCNNNDDRAASFAYVPRRTNRICINAVTPEYVFDVLSVTPFKSDTTGSYKKREGKWKVITSGGGGAETSYLKCVFLKDISFCL